MLHHLASWLRLRSAAIRRAIDRWPVVLVEGGALLPDALEHVHLTEADVWRVLRQHQVRDVAELDLLVMEGTGVFSVGPSGRRTDRPRLLAGLDRPASGSV